MHDDCKNPLSMHISSLFLEAFASKRNKKRNKRKKKEQKEKKEKKMGEKIMK